MWIVKKCLKCCKEFKIHTCIIKNSRGKYCSKECYWNSGNHPNGIGSSRWKGDNVGYVSLHDWVVRKLGKPSFCVDCGTKTAKRFEWANISGEYRRDVKDYKRLCVKCHRSFDYHLTLKGEKHPQSKLTEKNIIKIRKMYIPGKYTMEKLAKKFHVDYTTIGQIIRKRTWKHV